LAEQESVGVWMLQVASLKASAAEDSTKQADAARQAYVRTLKQRRDHAAARNDATAVSRYDALIKTGVRQRCQEPFGGRPRVRSCVRGRDR
jgi:hypothetical protein